MTSAARSKPMMALFIAVAVLAGFLVLELVSERAGSIAGVVAAAAVAFFAALAWLKLRDSPRS